MSQEHETALDLLRHLFPPESAVPDWQSFVDRVSAAFDGVFCGIWVEASSQSPTAVSCPEVAERLQTFDWTAGDDWSRRWPRVTYPVGKVAPFAADSVDGGQFYREVLEPAGFAREGFHVSLSADENGISTTFYVYPRLGVDNRAVVRERLELLMPWLLHATRTTIGAQRVVRVTEVLRRSLDRLRIGVVLLDELTHVVFANRSAVSLLEGPEAEPFDWLSVDAARRRSLSDGLDRLLERDSTSPQCIILARIDLGLEGVRPFEGRVCSAMLIADPEGAPVPSVEQLREHHGLTPAEARLSILLASGLSLEQAAARLGVKVGTVRTRIKQVFSKTDTNRQAALVRLLLSEAVPVRDE